MFGFLVTTFNLATLTNLMFYLTVFIGAILLRKIAANWEKMIRKALEIEVSLKQIRRPSKTLWKYSTITHITLFLALLEHILSIISRMSKVMTDLNESKITDRVMELYFSTSVPVIFNITSYSLWKAIPFFIANIQATFIWNITDVITMCISLYLTSYFDDLNNTINHREKYESITWSKLRMSYSQLVTNVKEVDSKFCHLVLLSFFTNLFFISLQLFNTLNAIYMTYYIYSFMFLTARACIMCLLAANVHKSAQEPLFVIRYVPSSEYTLDIQRFVRQILFTTTALSGVYFYVTRSTLLKVFGTVLTYELVLLQFNMVTEELMDGRSNSTSITSL
ncbi:gustatory receptor for sugar taste 64e-like [Battus philenor]|uniref:gustatory receptor for sugar taste 64e-like n=1 Tax=Battus philenor TaxID=42288 RepID=UPI0035D08730